VSLSREVDHPPPSCADVKERVDVYLYAPSGPSWPLLGRIPLKWPWCEADHFPTWCVGLRRDKYIWCVFLRQYFRLHSFERMGDCWIKIMWKESVTVHWKALFLLSVGPKKSIEIRVNMAVFQRIFESDTSRKQVSLLPESSCVTYRYNLLRPWNRTLSRLLHPHTRNTYSREFHLTGDNLLAKTTPEQIHRFLSYHIKSTCFIKCGVG
jgi:hypothetical protein